MSFARQNPSIEPVYQEIGKRIRWLRQQRGWSAKTLALKIGKLHQTTVIGWEVGGARIGVAELLLVADAFGIPLQTLLSKLPLADCQPSQEVIARRQELARKRIATQQKNGTLGRKGKKGNGVE